MNFFQRRCLLWTPAEDEVLRAAHRLSTPVKIVARDLGRTIYGVRWRRKRLRLGRMPPDAAIAVRHGHALGWSDYRIAREFLLPRSTVRGTRYRLGLAALYTNHWLPKEGA